MATTQPKVYDGRPRQPFDPNRWNASQVARRRDAAPADLVQELRLGAGALHTALMDVDLERPAAIGSFAGRPVAEALRRMGVHQRGHLEELRPRLAPPA